MDIMWVCMMLTSFFLSSVAVLLSLFTVVFAMRVLFRFEERIHKHKGFRSKGVGEKKRVPRGGGEQSCHSLKRGHNRAGSKQTKASAKQNKR